MQNALKESIGKQASPHQRRPRLLASVANMGSSQVQCGVAWSGAINASYIPGPLSIY